MAKYAHRSTVFTLFSCFWLLITITSVYGKGRNEPDLSKVDELISVREYDEATMILSEYIKRNPDKFELANQRLRKINEIRAEFNQYADELILVLLDDPENSEKILSLTVKLRSLENENSQLMVNFVAKTHEIALFNVNRKLLREILEKGRGFLDVDDGEGAIQTYAGGMGIMRDEFYTAGFGTQIENNVRQETERLNSMIASFHQESERIRTVSGDLSSAINTGQQARINELVNRLMTETERFIELRRNFNNSVTAIDRILGEIRNANPETGDRNHLAFLTILLHGRPEEDIQEGMLGAFDASWNRSVGSIIEGITLNIETIYKAGLSAFNSREYANVISSISGNERYISLSPLFFDKHRQFMEGADRQTISLYGNSILQDDLQSYLKFVSLNEASNVLLQAATIGVNRQIDRSSLDLWRQGRIELSDALSREQQTRNNITAMYTEIQEIKTKAIQTDTEISRHYNIPYIKDAVTAIDQLSSAIIVEQGQSAQRYYDVEYQDLERHLTARKEELEKGRSYLNGQSRTTEDGVEKVYRYPAEALEQFTSMLSAVTANLEHGNSVLSQFTNEPQAIASNTELARLRTNYQGLVNELNSIRSQGTALANTARSSTELAASQRQEGERLLNEAQAAYNRQDYEAARLTIQRASEQFDKSLETQESASVREIRDTQLINLGRAIAIAENERIIAEVRNLVNSARNSYFNGDFQTAENSLTRARDRWLITNTEENEEVLYWLGMVRGGTSARSGRVIPSTAPLYPEMSQLLSQAQRNFDEGVRYINAGQRDTGLAKFDEARLQTREVKLMFPVNQEAGLLELRMEQFIDPAAFNASFEQRLRTAINGTKQRSLEAYADLQNLAEINPRYTGIRAILDQAEIDMGFRPAPPNPANLARSRELTASASRILEGNLTAQFEVALAQINEAITLNPDNTDATRVKDRLLSRMSAPGAIVLSSEDEEQYQRAVRELQAGNNLVALSLVDRLLQNPRNRNITKLMELQRRIQSVL